MILIFEKSTKLLKFSKISNYSLWNLNYIISRHLHRSCDYTSIFNNYEIIVYNIFNKTDHFITTCSILI